MDSASVICILGMHRSGTSVVARILNLMGVDLGPEEKLLLGASPANPKGFWEHQEFIRLNNEILARLGGNWYNPPPLPAGWEEDPELEDIRQRALELIREEYGNAAVWGWKDPRTCLTLPFWQKIQPQMRYVICARQPMDVARSLERRNGFPVEKGIYLWLTHMRSALEQTVGRPCCFIVYEDLMAHWRQELCRLAEFLGKPDLADSVEVQNAVRGFIDPSLQHHRTPMVETPSTAELDLPARALSVAQHVYGSLKQGLAHESNIAIMLEEVLDAIEMQTQKQKRQAYLEWLPQVQLAKQEIADMVPAGQSFILVDDDQWETDECISGRRRIPFLEREGRYWGPPPDDDTAVREFERLRQAGAGFVVFGWPAFWWLDCYSGLHQHLRSRFPCPLENDRLVVFDLRQGQHT